MSSRTDEQQNQNLLLSENKQPYTNISPSPKKKKKNPTHLLFSRQFFFYRVFFQVFIKVDLSACAPALYQTNSQVQLKNVFPMQKFSHSCQYFFSFMKVKKVKQIKKNIIS